MYVQNCLFIYKKWFSNSVNMTFYECTRFYRLPANLNARNETIFYRNLNFSMNSGADMKNNLIYKIIYRNLQMTSLGKMYLRKVFMGFSEYGCFNTFRDSQKWFYVAVRKYYWLL